MRNFGRSEVIPYPFGFKTTRNPILECISDQTRLDPEWSRRNLSDMDLLMGIIRGLESRRIQWPVAFSLIPCDQWVHNMKRDATFYDNYARNPGEWQAFDALLCQLLSDHLGRRISLIPFLETDQQKTFIPKNSNSATISYHLLYCNKLLFDSFYVSIFPKDPVNVDPTLDLSSSRTEDPSENVSTLTYDDQLAEAIALSLEDDISPEASSEQEGSGAGKAIEDMTEEEQLDYVLRLSTIIQ